MADWVAHRLAGQTGNCYAVQITGGDEVVSCGEPCAGLATLLLVSLMLGVPWIRYSDTQAGGDETGCGDASGSNPAC